ncbi:MAG: DMT family transporter [Alphaproteobacteria bacterium]|nr:DMT family transporter [Alphaproteobacteria bacterium]
MTAETLDLDAQARSRTIGVALAAGGAALFSMKGVVIKLAFAEGMGVNQLLTLRMAFSLPLFLVVGVFAFLRAGKKPAAKVYAAAAGLGILSYYISSYLNFLGLQYVSAQLERLILYIYPTMVAMLAWLFLREPVTRRHLIALALAYAGVIVLFGTEIGRQGEHAWLGGGLVFASAFLYAIYVTASKVVIARMGSTLFTAFAMSAASIAFLAQSGVEMLVAPPPPVTTNGLWLSLVLAFVCTVIPSFMIADAIGRIGPGPMSAIGGIGPIVAAWAAVVILHEPFGWPHLIAMALTIVGVWLLAGAPRPKALAEPGR